MTGRSAYTYELRSINLGNLPEREQGFVLERFASFLNSLTDGVSFVIAKDKRNVDALGATYEIPYMRFFVESSSSIDDLLMGLVGPKKFVRVPSASTLQVAHSRRGYIVDSGSCFVQTFNITRLGGFTPAAFLTQVYDIAHLVKLQIEPLETYGAKALSRQRARSLHARISLQLGEGRSVSPDLQIEFERVSVAAQLIAAGKERLFRSRTNITLREKSLQDLASARRKLRQVLGGIVEEIDSPKYMQEALLTGKGPSWATGRWLYVTTAGATKFFPFAGLDIVDPTGVFYGQSIETGNAIVFDLFEKENYNIAIAGQTGYGKSTYIKSTFGRMLLSDPDMCAWVFDSIVKPEYYLGPDGKYEHSFAGITGCRIHRFDMKAGAGLDPFAVFPDKLTAAKFLASVARVEGEESLMADLKLAAECSSSVGDLMNNTEGEVRKRLQANLPPYRFLFEGRMEIYPRMVFVLYDLPPGELRDAAAFLTLSAIWKQIEQGDVIPVNRRKAIIIDEGWSLVEVNPRTGKPYFPMAVEYVPKIARTGRHYNTAFAIATQLISDLMGRDGVSGPGRTMIESCATKVVLHQDQASSEILRRAFNLGEQEERFILNAGIGQGILATPEGHIQFYNFLSPEEGRLFTTRPKDVAS